MAGLANYLIYYANKNPAFENCPKNTFLLTVRPSMCFVAVLMMELLFLSILKNKDAQILSSLRLYTLLHFFGNALCIFGLKATTKL